MTLWIAWSMLVSALVALAATAAERAAAHLGAARRFIWFAALIATTLVPLALALRSAPATAPLAAPSPAATTSRTTAAVISSQSTADPHVDRFMRANLLLANATTVARRADPWIARVWLLTSLMLLAAFARSFVALRRQRARWSEGETDDCRVLVSRDAGPAVVGFLHPRIVLPAWVLSTERGARELLLRHELEHVRAGDSRALIAADFLRILFPWNAALWWMTRQLRLAVEIDCDARVIRASGRTREYGLVLLAVGERYATALPLAASLTESRLTLEARINAMTAPRQRRPVLASLPFVAIAVVVLTAATRAPQPAPLRTARAVAPPVAATASHEQPAQRLSLDAPLAASLATPLAPRIPIRPAALPVDTPPVQQVTSEPMRRRPAGPYEGNPTPSYPPMLRAAGVEGDVVLTVRTDSRGVPDTSTLVVRQTTHELFTQAVRATLPDWRLEPNAEVPINFTFVLLTQLPTSDSTVHRISAIGVSDIENVEIIKGPAAATEYGPDAMNGVIVIKTKAGATALRYGSRPIDAFSGLSTTVFGVR